jgi:hypothetical protein
LDEASAYQLLDGNMAPSVLWGSCLILDATVMQATEKNYEKVRKAKLKIGVWTNFVPVHHSMEQPNQMPAVQLMLNYWSSLV